MDCRVNRSAAALEFFAWVDAVESVGFVARGDFAFAQADDRKSFGRAHAGAMPPIAADGAGEAEGLDFFRFPPFFLV